MKQVIDRSFKEEEEEPSLAIGLWHSYGRIYLTLDSTPVICLNEKGVFSRYVVSDDAQGRLKEKGVQFKDDFVKHCWE